jgi:hypothetical protein
VEGKERKKNGSKREKGKERDEKKERKRKKEGRKTWKVRHVLRRRKAKEHHETVPMKEERIKVIKRGRTEGRMEGRTEGRTDGEKREGKQGNK